MIQAEVPVLPLYIVLSPIIITLHNKQKLEAGIILKLGKLNCIQSSKKHGFEK